MNDLISVIVPVYNVEKCLDRCINSLVNQKYDNIELILVDDGSTDSSGKICDFWKDKDERVVVVHQANQGAAEARNTGLEIAQGDVISFVDSDDVVDRCYLEMLYNYLDEYHADISGCIAVNDENMLFSNHADMKYEIETSSSPLLTYLSGEGDAVWHRIYRKSLLEGILFDKEYRNGEDILFSYLAFSRAKKYVTTNCPLYYWNLGTQSLSRSPVTSIDNPAYLVYMQACKDRQRPEVVDVALQRALLFTFRIITRSLRFGFSDVSVENEYNFKKDELIKTIRKNFFIIVQSQSFRVIDKLQVIMIAWCYHVYVMIYKGFKR